MTIDNTSEYATRSKIYLRAGNAETLRGAAVCDADLLGVIEP